MLFRSAQEDAIDAAARLHLEGIEHLARPRSVVERIDLVEHQDLTDAGSVDLVQHPHHLLELLESPFASRNFDLHPERIGRLRRHTHDFLMQLERIRYDYWEKIPVLIDWNLGNFSVDRHADGSFHFFSRWDYDWFRIEPRLMDFYFCSRVSSRTGDRTHWTYGPHTLTEEPFLRFLGAYHEVYPLSQAEVEFIPETYRFFILNYVVREGARFFRADLCEQFRRDAATRYLPALDELDIEPIRQVVRPR